MRIPIKLRGKTRCWSCKLVRANKRRIWVRNSKRRKRSMKAQSGPSIKRSSWLICSWMRSLLTRGMDPEHGVGREKLLLRKVTMITLRQKGMTIHLNRSSGIKVPQRDGQGPKTWSVSLQRHLIISIGTPLKMMLSSLVCLDNYMLAPLTPIIQREFQVGTPPNEISVRIHTISQLWAARSQPARNSRTLPIS